LLNTGTGFEVIYDTVGGATLDASFHAVQRIGHVVRAGLGSVCPGAPPPSFRAASYSGVFTLLPLLTGESREHHGEILRATAHMVGSGQVRPTIDPRRFSRDDAEEAHAAVRQRSTKGKVVIDVAA